MDLIKKVNPNEIKTNSEDILYKLHKTKPIKNLYDSQGSKTKQTINQQNTRKVLKGESKSSKRWKEKNLKNKETVLEDKWMKGRKH